MPNMYPDMNMPPPMAPPSSDITPNPGVGPSFSIPDPGAGAPNMGVGAGASVPHSGSEVGIDDLEARLAALKKF